MMTKVANLPTIIVFPTDFRFEKISVCHQPTTCINSFLFLFFQRQKQQSAETFSQHKIIMLLYYVDILENQNNDMKISNSCETSNCIRNNYGLLYLFGVLLEIQGPQAGNHCAKSNKDRDSRTEVGRPSSPICYVSVPLIGL